MHPRPPVVTRTATPAPDTTRVRSHDPHLRITKLSLERRRGYGAGEGEQRAQATSCLHQKVPVTQSEQESTASPHAEDGLNTGAWQLLNAGVTHTNPR